MNRLLRIVCLFVKSLQKTGLLDNEVVEEWLLQREAVIKGVSSMPDTITLSQVNEIVWRDPDRVQAYRKALKAFGCQRVGRYAVDEYDNYLMEACVQHDHDCYGIISQHPQIGVWFEITGSGEEDSNFTVVDKTQSMPTHPPWQTTIYMPGKTPRAIIKRFLAERPEGQPRVVDGPLFAKHMRRSYRRETAWRTANV